MRLTHRQVTRGFMLAMIAVACAHCGSTKGAVRGGSDAGDTDAQGAAADGGDIGTDPEASTGPEGDASVVDSGGDATSAGTGSDTCATATVIPLVGKNPRVDLAATTSGAAHDVDAPCTADQGPDTFYKFTVSKPVFVYADTFGATWNTVLFLLSDTCQPLTTTMTGGAVCSDDSCGTSQSQIVARLEPGSYRLGLGGRGGASGDAVIHFEWAIAGSGTTTQLPPTDSVQMGTTTGEGNLSTLSNDCVAAAGENSYWWARCPSDPARTIHASTCTGTSFESVVEMQVPKLAPGIESAYRCNIDGCGGGSLQGALGTNLPAGAGLGVLSVDGQSGNDFGPYSMTVTYTP